MPALILAAIKNFYRTAILPYKGEALKTITTDNGSEFAEHEWITRMLNVPVFFADSYSSWQKGAVENENKLIRQYIPKGTDISSVTEAKIIHFQDHEANTHVSLDASPREVEHGAYLYLRLCNAEGALHMPQVVVGVINVPCRYVRVCQITFQSIPTGILLYPGVVYGHLHVAVHREELVVAPLVYVILCQLLPSS